MIDGLQPHGSYSDRDSRKRDAQYRASHPYDRGTWQQNEYARAELDPLYGTVIVADDPDAPDAVAFDDDIDWTPPGAYGPAQCPYRVGTRHPRQCRHDAGHDGGHDWPSERELRARMAPAPEKRAAAGRKAPPRPKSRRTAPKARPASRPVMSPATVAYDGGPLASCPRCGRLDWQTPAGRQWHLDNYPACASHRKPERHRYDSIGG